MNAASQVPSGVLISTSVSTISMPMSAAAVDVTVTAMPALTKRVAKSRRVMSPGCGLFVGWLFSSSVMALCKEFIAFRWQTAPSDHQSPWGGHVPRHFLQRAGHRVIPEIVTRSNFSKAVGQTTIECGRLYLPQRAYLTPRGGLLFLIRVRRFLSRKHERSQRQEEYVADH